MGKLWTIIKREYRERVRTKWFVIATVFGPVFFGSLILVPAYMTKKSKASNEFTNTIILDATSIDMGAKVGGGMSAWTTARLGSSSRQGDCSTRALASGKHCNAPGDRQAGHGYLILNEETLRGEKLRYAGRNATSIGDMERVRTTVKETLLAERLEGLGSRRTR
jgi:ABC-2 type transport system permease protein